jgi:hypothetical protein
VRLDVAKSVAMAKRSPGAGSTSKAAADREDLFIAAYMGNGFNRSAAARAAGFSEKTSKEKGSEMFRRCEDRIDALVKAKVAALHLKGDEVLRDLADDFRADRRGLYRRDGTLKAPHELTAEQMRLVDSLEVDEVSTADGKVRVRTVKVRLGKHIATREQAMRHLGLFPRDQGPADPDEQARLVRERLGDIRKLNQKE